MAVNPVPTLGWTRGNVAATILLVTQEERDHIARRVRELMTKHGYTNAALAYRAGVAEKTVSRVINAKREARYDTLDRIAKVFDLTERDLRGPQQAPLALTPEPSLNGSEITQLDRIELAISSLEAAQVQTGATLLEVIQRLDAMQPPAAEAQ